jgi:HK97 family phage portal protein
MIDMTHLIAGDAEVNSGPNAYKNNVIVHKCVNLISQSVSHVPWVVIKKKNDKVEKEINHPLLRLLNRPNPRNAGVDFFAEVVANLLLFGNAYILSCGSKGGSPQELHLLHPSQTDIIISEGRQVAYRYITQHGEKRYPINPYSAKSSVLHLKTYNPYDQVYGLSCLTSAALSIDTHYQASKWNNSLLTNGVRPSGALVMKDGGSYLSEEQFERLKEQFYSQYSGSSGAGKPLILEGGLDWREMSITPKDMDFIESKNSSAREIALAFGVPPQLLGINGDNTYSNMQEARMALWEETLIPILEKISDALTHWLTDWFVDDVYITFDKDSISAIEHKRESLWCKVAASDFMTINEKRSFVGLRPIEGGDKLNVQ